MIWNTVNNWVKSVSNNKVKYKLTNIYRWTYLGFREFCSKQYQNKRLSLYIKQLRFKIYFNFWGDLTQYSYGISYMESLNYYNYNFFESKLYVLLHTMSKTFGVKNAPLKYRIKNISFGRYLSYTLLNLKWIALAFVISLTYFIISLFYIQIDFAKQVAVWYIFIVVYYLLISTFNSFIIKYKYGKFTSAIQRFWKRTGIIFWLIEGFLFLLFFYYYLNSSQEPLYMFDYSSLNQELLIQLKATYRNLILVSVAIYLSFILMYSLNYLFFLQSILLLLIIALILFYSLYLESYQFIYIISLFSDKIWIFEDITQSWILDIEQSNIRVKQQYFIYCLIAKYWHFIFIFVSWFFFLLKSLELRKISYTSLGYNTQNLIILYFLNLACLIQWFKFFIKKFLDVTYSWFHLQYDSKFFRDFAVEIINTSLHLFSINYTLYLEFINHTIKSLNTLLSNSLDLWKFI